VLDDATLGDLFRDLSLAARVLDVRVKGSATPHASGEAWGLLEARAAFVQKAVLGIQIRYQLANAEIWRDTLMHTALGIRLVRIKEPNLEST
jgi:hypothetical protein